MARKPNIKWRESDAEKLANEIERFNAKIYRTKRRHPELADIQPQTIKKADRLRMESELKSLPRSEFNKQLHSLQRYSKKGAEKEIVSKTGNRVTKYEKKEVSLQVRSVNVERKKERERVENMEATSRGQNLGLKRGEMGDTRTNSLQPKKFDFDSIKPGVEWDKYKASVRKQASIKEREVINQRYKDNYLKGLDGYGGYADRIKSLVDQLPADVVVTTFYAEEQAQIEFYYEGLDGRQEASTVLSIIEGVWETALKDYKESIKFNEIIR